MRLSILAMTAALIACPAATQTPDAPPLPPLPPRPMRDSPPPQPPIKAPPATLTEADATCQGGDQPACEEAAKIRTRILSGGSLVPDLPPVSGTGGKQ